MQQALFFHYTMHVILRDVSCNKHFVHYRMDLILRLSSRALAMHVTSSECLVKGLGFRRQAHSVNYSLQSLLPALLMHTI